MLEGQLVALDDIPKKTRMYEGAVYAYGSTLHHM